jgi:hypothetical protein
VTSYLSTATGGAVKSLPWLGASFYTLVSLMLSTLAYTLLYSTVPNQTVDWRDAAAGGLLAGIGLEIAKRLFAAYILQFPTYTMVYGTVAVLPIFLVWIYMMWMITLFGALLTAALPVVRYERWWHVPSPGAVHRCGQGPEIPARGARGRGVGRGEHGRGTARHQAGPGRTAAIAVTHERRGLGGLGQARCGQPQPARLEPPHHR